MANNVAMNDVQSINKKKIDAFSGVPSFLTLPFDFLLAS